MLLFPVTESSLRIASGNTPGWWMERKSKSGYVGNVIRNTLPLPSALSTSIRPRWCSTDHLAMAKPKPCPPSARERGEVHRTQLARAPATLQPRQREQGFDEIVETLRFLQHAADGVPQFRRIAGLPQSHFPDRAQGGQRRAQLMGGIGREALEFGERALEAMQRRVEVGGQLAEFGVRVANRE